MAVSELLRLQISVQSLTEENEYQSGEIDGLLNQVDRLKAEVKELEASSKLWKQIADNYLTQLFKHVRKRCELGVAKQFNVVTIDGIDKK